jgi:hypothetical protein
MKILDASHITLPRADFAGEKLRALLDAEFSLMGNTFGTDHGIVLAVTLWTVGKFYKMRQ